MEFVDYDWDDIVSSFVKEGILGADFTFTTKSELTHTIDYLPKNQARKLYTYAKEQLDLLKNGSPIITASGNSSSIDTTQELDEIEEMDTEEVTNFAEIIPVKAYTTIDEDKEEVPTITTERKLNELSQDELFEKLQNYKKLLDNGLILQGEYDN